MTRSWTRRDFLGHAAIGAAGVMTAGALRNARGQAAGALTATDLVSLNKSAVKVSRLGLGTGSNGGHDQRQMGQEAFEKMIRHAIDRGVTFLDTAENYRGMHAMLKPVIAQVDREKIQIQAKIPHGKYDNALEAIDQYRAELGTEYFDTLLIHCVMSKDWVEELKPLRDQLDEAKEKGIIRANGCSIHGLPPLNATVASDWGDVRFVRVNPDGVKMDGPTGDWNEKGEVDQVLPCIRKMHEQGKGIIGMKLIGNGEFTDPETRGRSIDFVMGLDYVDAVIIGCKSIAEVDEAIARINSGLAKRPQPILV